MKNNARQRNYQQISQIGSRIGKQSRKDDHKRDGFWRRFDQHGVDGCFEQSAVFGNANSQQRHHDNSQRRKTSVVCYHFENDAMNAIAR